MLIESFLHYILSHLLNDVQKAFSLWVLRPSWGRWARDISPVQGTTHAFTCVNTFNTFNRTWGQLKRQSTNELILGEYPKTYKKPTQKY